MSEEENVKELENKEMNEETSAPEAEPGKSGKKREKAKLILFIIIIAGVLITTLWWLRDKSFISTDDAFIDGNIHDIAPKVSGIVKNLAITDNQFVHKGDLLFEIDPADYHAKVAEATAALNVAANDNSSDLAKVDQSRAELNQSRAQLTQAESDLARGKALFAREVIPKEQFEKIQTAERVARTEVEAKEENYRRASAEAGLSAPGGKDAKVAQRQAELETAKLNLSYTRVFAPTDGYVTRRTVEVGNYIQPGQSALAIVPLNDIWITANYKESQLTHVRAGQKVVFTVDTYGGKKFRGTVNSIMAGTGAAFSLLPPENATGNYVKVVQRIPVKIDIDRSSDPKHVLRIGMSVEPTIHTGESFFNIVKEMIPFRKETR
ncbi:MAG: HlyD family secretion protein [Desulfuromonadales bacterium]|nr:HlyD family secretion protein [Desulfuromonadales bacterium]